MHPGTCRWCNAVFACIFSKCSLWTTITHSRRCGSPRCSHVARRPPVLCAQHRSGVTLAGHGSTLVPEVKGKVSFFRIGLVLARKSEATIGSKTCIGLTYLELDLVDVLWLVGVSKVRAHTDETSAWLPVKVPRLLCWDRLTKLDTMILVSPFRIAAGAVGAALDCLPWRVDLETPPTGAAAAAGRPAPERRLLRPRPRVGWLALRMSSRLCSILFDDMLVSGGGVVILG
jgi:hypothetical protein